MGVLGSRVLDPAAWPLSPPRRVTPQDRSAVSTAASRGQDGVAALGAHLPGPFSLGPAPGRDFGEMFPLLGCRTGFPREPGPWDPRPFPGPDGFPWNEKDRRWAPTDCPPPPAWDDSRDYEGPEDGFRDGLRLELLMPDPGNFDWPKFPKKEQRPPWPPALMSGWVPVARDPPVVSEKLPESPKAASSPQKSPAADIQAATEAAEPEQVAGATPVEPGAGQKPTDRHGQSPPALGMEPAPPEKSSAGTGEHPEVESCSQSVPEAGAGDGSEPPGPTAPLEPTERVRMASGSSGEEGAEPCHCSQGHQCLPSGDGGAKAACDGLLGGLQPSKTSQVPAGAAPKPDTEPSQASSSVCTMPVTSPGTQDPPGAGETETAAGSQHWLCSTLQTSIPAGMDLRSAVILARKEEIELSYQQFSLTIAVVATMLLQKEPSMETALGLALRANLHQGRIHHLRELEDFINSYDSATLSR
ncbi:LOW QUALITY PROTEIN: uncharacterized protein FYW35_010549 [Pterocles gutturalis]